jgi:hypothetical protein
MSLSQHYFCIASNVSLDFARVLDADKRIRNRLSAMGMGTEIIMTLKKKA